MKKMGSGKTFFVVLVTVCAMCFLALQTSAFAAQKDKV